MSLSKNKLLMGWGEPRRASAKQLPLDDPAFYFPDFFLTIPQPWIQYSQWSEISKVELYHLLHPVMPPPPCNWDFRYLEKFKQAFDELQELLQVGHLQKGVPYLFSDSSDLMVEERLHFCLKRALEQTTGYLYGHWDVSSGILGITPELLFSHAQHQPQIVQTMALAGTCPTSCCQEAFFEDEKERDEHQIVVQGICQSLQALGEVKIGKIQCMQLPRLIHLMTPIEIKLSHSFDFHVLVNCLHPTPALGAFPILEGNVWLKNFQKHTPRHYYGSPIGFHYPPSGLSKCFVAIRNVQWDTLGMHIGVGCGVVKQSIFNQEWQEVQSKLASIQEQLGL